ncbi:MAG TPA: CobD/CbiB family cobalamin biosynthesis protein, partial [Nitrospiraceae bacterium]|nr:CobD/CbiB family cobalamin biosynthesis protein [Nitrospiraceae bacterium]
MTPIDLIVACALDAVLGDPRRLPHPVRLMGKIIGGFEARIRKMVRGPGAVRMAGIVLALGLPVMSYAAGAWMIELATRLHPQAGRWVGIWLAFTTLAARDLVDHARAVMRELETGSLVRARQAVSRIVGRDTDHLSEPEVVRATVETIAESTSDGVIAPLVY